MPEALRTKRTETTLAPEPSEPSRRIQRTVDSTRLPLYTQAWGNLPPPWLRLPVPQHVSAEQPVQRQQEEGLRRGDEQSPVSTQETPQVAPQEEPLQEGGESAQLEEEDEGSEEKDFEDVIKTAGHQTVMLGSATHQVEIRMVEGVPMIGVASTWTTLNSIIDTLLKAAKDPKSEIAGRQNDIKQIFAPAQSAYAWFLTTQTKHQKLRQAVRKRPKVGVKKASQDKVLQNLIRQRNSAHRTAVAAAFNLERVAKEAIAEAWEEFGEFLPAHLIPVGEVFKKRPFAGDRKKYTYHTGTALDPIPIYWYKPPADYPKITYKGKTYEYDDPVKIGGVLFGVTNENNPNEPDDFQLRKSAHNETRAEQKRFNDIFNNNGVIVGGTTAPALGAKGYDGDHVKDLGFGGTDDEDNYWPLAAEINRRAFNGFNSRYIVNYKDITDNKYYSRAIGGLIGKYFIVKGYWNGAVPDESGEEEAGTDQV